MTDTLLPTGPRRGRPSIVLRLTIAVIVVLAAGASVALYSARAYGDRAADEAYDRLLTGAALQIAERVSLSDGGIVVDIPISAFELLALARNDRVFYRVVGLNGETLTGYNDLPLPENDGPVTYDSTYLEVPIRATQAIRPIVERDISGEVRVIVAQTTSERNALTRDFTTRAAILIAAASFAMLALSWFVLRYALKPLTRVEQALLARDPNDLSPFEIETPREIETVVDAINRFTRRLDRRVTAVQSFVADAAHQLRTPITAIRAQAQLAVDEESPQALRRISRRIHDRSVLVSRLADQLLSHAMVTHRSDLAQHETLDLRRVALEAEEESATLARGSAAQPTLLLDETGEVPVTGDRFSLREAVKNLINNAFVHGKPPVDLLVFREDGMGVVAVRDSGSGIAQADREKAGVRFHRGEAAHPGGAGIGLSIAREVAMAHGGRVGFRDIADGRFEVRIELPLAAEVDA